MSMAIYRDVVAGASPAVPSRLATVLPDLLWLAHLSVTLYWVIDTSPGQERTRQLVERSVTMLGSAVRVARLPGAASLVKQVGAVLDVVVPGGGRREHGREPAPLVGRGFRGIATPGVGGYFLAWLASAAALPLVAWLGVLVPGGEPTDLAVTDVIPALGFALVFAIVAALYGAPAALVGCLVVHAACRRVRPQVPHVAAAGIAGVVTGWAYDAFLFQHSWDSLWLQLGVATAIGRASVIPLARRRMS